MVHTITMTDVSSLSCVEKVNISIFNLPIQGQENEQSRDLNGEDVDTTLAGKKTLLDLRSLSFILILPALSISVTTNCLQADRHQVHNGAGEEGG